MTLRIRLSPEAETDVAEIYQWYEQARTGLGDRFVQAVDTALRQVADYPQMGRPLHRGIRRVLLQRFPYGVSYVFDHTELFVLGCLHLRRNPGVWRSREPPPQPDA